MPMLNTQRDRHLEKLYWNKVVAKTLRGAPINAWRAYMQQVYRGLIQKWFSEVNSGRTLKTDLFEEAITPFHLLPDFGPGSIGIDQSPSVVRAASERLMSEGRKHLIVVGDLRRIPLRSGSIKQILSGSSLDHFLEKEDIVTSLKELERVLAEGGTLILTFDNPHNPVVWLRNRLPFALLNHLRLIPYYVGPTYNCTEARRQLDTLGLEVIDTTVVSHAPRAPAIWLIALLEHLGCAKLEPMLVRILTAFEVMERWPTRYRTGYYLAFRVEKSTSERPLDE